MHFSNIPSHTDIQIYNAKVITIILHMVSCIYKLNKSMLFNDQNRMQLSTNVEDGNSNNAQLHTNNRSQWMQLYSKTVVCKHLL